MNVAKDDMLAFGTPRKKLLLTALAVSATNPKGTS
jgi:hypothetical protein